MRARPLPSPLHPLPGALKSKQCAPCAALALVISRSFFLTGGGGGGGRRVVRDARTKAPLPLRCPALHAAVRRLQVPLATPTSRRARAVGPLLVVRSVW